MNPLSLLPSLRSNKEEGQANFVNPGSFPVANLGADFNGDDQTARVCEWQLSSVSIEPNPWSLLLFQHPIQHSIGIDLGVGLEYRPPLSENIIVTVGGVCSRWFRAQASQEIYNGKTLFSVFTKMKFQF